MKRPASAPELIAASGMSVEQVCQAARVGPRYLRRLLREGAPYDTAERLARVLGCRIEVFLRTRAVETPVPVRRGGAAGGLAAGRAVSRTRSPKGKAPSAPARGEDALRAVDVARPFASRSRGPRPARAWSDP